MVGGATFVKAWADNSHQGGQISRKIDQEIGRIGRHMQVGFVVGKGRFRVDPGEVETPKEMGKSAKGFWVLNFAYK